SPTRAQMIPEASSVWSRKTRTAPAAMLTTIWLAAMRMNQRRCFRGVATTDVSKIPPRVPITTTMKVARIDPPRAISSDAVSANMELALIAAKNPSRAMRTTPRGCARFSGTDEVTGGESISSLLPQQFPGKPISLTVDPVSSPAFTEVRCSSFLYGISGHCRPTFVGEKPKRTRFGEWCSRGWACSSPQANGGFSFDWFFALRRFRGWCGLRGTVLPRSHLPLVRRCDAAAAAPGLAGRCVPGLPCHQGRGVLGPGRTVDCCALRQSAQPEDGPLPLTGEGIGDVFEDDEGPGDGKYSHLGDPGGGEHPLEFQGQRFGFAVPRRHVHVVSASGRRVLAEVHHDGGVSEIHPRGSCEHMRIGGATGGALHKLAVQGAALVHQPPAVFCVDPYHGDRVRGEMCAVAVFGEVQVVDQDLAGDPVDHQVADVGPPFLHGDDRAVGGDRV